MLSVDYQPLPLRFDPVATKATSAVAAAGSGEKKCSGGTGGGLAVSLMGARFMVNTSNKNAWTQLACHQPMLHKPDVTLQWLTPVQQTSSAEAILQDEVACLCDGLLRTWMEHPIRLLNPDTDPLSLAQALGSVSEFILTHNSQAKEETEPWMLWTSHWLPVKKATNNAVSEFTDILASKWTVAQGIVVDNCAIRLNTPTSATADTSFPSAWDELRAEHMQCLIVDVRLGFQCTLYHRDLPHPVHFSGVQAQQSNFLRECLLFFEQQCQRPSVMDGDRRWRTGELIAQTLATKEPVGFSVLNQRLYHLFYLPGAPGRLASEMLTALLHCTTQQYKDLPPPLTVASTLSSGRKSVVGFELLTHLDSLGPVDAYSWKDVLAVVGPTTAAEKEKAGILGGGGIRKKLKPGTPAASSFSAALDAAVQSQNQVASYCRRLSGSVYYPIPRRCALAEWSPVPVSNGGPGRGKGAGQHAFLYQQLLYLKHEQARHSARLSPESDAWMYVRHMASNRFYRATTATAIAPPPPSSSVSSSSSISSSSSSSSSSSVAITEEDEVMAEGLVLGPH